MLAIFLPQNSHLTMDDSGFKKQENFPFSGKIYNSYSMIGATAGSEYKLLIKGVPEGRGDYWVVGWVIAGLLLLGGGLGAYLTKPKLTNTGQEAEVVG